MNNQEPLVSLSGVCREILHLWNFFFYRFLYTSRLISGPLHDTVCFLHSHPQLDSFKLSIEKAMGPDGVLVLLLYIPAVLVKWGQGRPTGKLWITSQGIKTFFPGRWTTIGTHYPSLAFFVSLYCITALNSSNCRVWSCHPAFPQCLRIDICAWFSHLTSERCQSVIPCSLFSCPTFLSGI